MTRSTLLKLAGALLAVLLPACSTVPKTTGSAAWPPAKFHTVRAFVYDCEAERHSMTFCKPDGSFHKGVLNAPGALLSAAQTQRLLNAVNTPAPLDKYKPCYVPHHAFVFYDEAGKQVANLEVCFTCRRHIATPAGVPEHINYGVLWSLLHELNVPAERTPGYYRKLYRDSKSRN